MYRYIGAAFQAYPRPITRDLPASWTFPWTPRCVLLYSVILLCTQEGSFLFSLDWKHSQMYDQLALSSAYAPVQFSFRKMAYYTQSKWKLSMSIKSRSQTCASRLIATFLVHPSSPPLSIPQERFDARSSLHSSLAVATFPRRPRQRG